MFFVVQREIFSAENCLWCLVSHFLFTIILSPSHFKLLFCKIGCIIIAQTFKKLSEHSSGQVVECGSFSLCVKSTLGETLNPKLHSVSRAVFKDSFASITSV